MHFSTNDNGWFRITCDGKHYNRFFCTLKTRSKWKPYVPDTGYRDQGPVLTESDEIKRGEAGDPLLPSQIAATLTNDSSKFDHHLWGTPLEKVDGKMRKLKKHNQLSGPTNSSLKIRDTDAGFMHLCNLNVQQRYDVTEKEVTSGLPPTVAAMEKIADSKGLEEPMKNNVIIKMQDRLNLKFLGVQANLRACWNTVNHVANLEHQNFYEILDDPNLQAVLSYDCYPRRWHAVYGDFIGTKYVMSIQLVKTFFCS